MTGMTGMTGMSPWNDWNDLMAPGMTWNEGWRIFNEIRIQPLDELRTDLISTVPFVPGTWCLAVALT